MDGIQWNITHKPKAHILQSYHYNKHIHSFNSSTKHFSNRVLCSSTLKKRVSIFSPLTTPTNLFVCGFASEMVSLSLPESYPHFDFKQTFCSITHQHTKTYLYTHRIRYYFCWVFLAIKQILYWKQYSGNVYLKPDILGFWCLVFK